MIFRPLYLPYSKRPIPSRFVFKSGLGEHEYMPFNKSCDYATSSEIGLLCAVGSKRRVGPVYVFVTSPYHLWATGYGKDANTCVYDHSTSGSCPWKVRTANPLRGTLRQVASGLALLPGELNCEWVEL